MAAMHSINSFKTGVGFGASLTRAPTLLSTGITGDNAWGVLFNVVVANIPQSFVSLVNVFYNGLLTCMLLGEEWNNFAFQRQPLRVTEPKGLQKGKYYLTIPYWYAIPIMVMCGALHLLTSESLFFARIKAYYEGEEVPSSTISSIGYSALSMAFACIVSLLMLGFIDIKARRRFNQGPPLVSHCSAAISAACHLPPHEIDAALKPLQWGVVKGAGDSIGSWKNKDKDFGHCSFSSELVTPPIPGYYYA